MKRMLFVGVALAIVLAGCGGDLPGAYNNAIYVQIKSDGSLNPSAAYLPNGGRIIFVNNDSIAHTVNWEPPLTLYGTADPGKRVWFDLPTGFLGAVYSYHLDQNGPSGSVTLIRPI